MTLTFRIVSIFFHPLLMVTYLLLMLFWVNPILFIHPKPEFKGVLFFSVFFSTFLIPFIAILMMWFMKLIPTLEMEDKRHRIGPLIATCIFYLWIYINLRNNPEIPVELTGCLLGVLITLFVVFFINIFMKVSLHAAGAGGMVMATILFTLNSIPSDLTIAGTNLVIQPMVLVAVACLLAGVIGSARLYLKAHTSQEVYGGYFLGFAGQMMAFLYAW
jgi:membrane-associated phospholipid phosphatase